MKMFGTIFLFLFSEMIMAHGMDQLGPHQGFIQMPGAFHTEVVPQKSGLVKVYLLDIEFKNPMVAQSEVQLSLKTERTVEFKCTAQADYFECQFPDIKNKFKKGELILKASRDGHKGREAIYKLPLKLQK